MSCRNSIKNSHINTYIYQYLTFCHLSLFSLSPLYIVIFLNLFRISSRHYALHY